MKSYFYALTTLFMLVTSGAAIAQEDRFGLGIILGEPTGVSAKLWVSPVTALDFGLGWSIGGDRIGDYHGGFSGGSRVHFHMDYLWHWFDVVTTTQRFPLYSGIGGRINTGAGYESSTAIRGVFGIAWLISEAPIDIFLELVPSLQVAPSTGINIDSGIGARFFF